MAGAYRLQNNEMLRMMQLEHLERQRRWILQQPPEMCPRCNSMETKFCYFNNYSADQPRYFCKACKRHWTKGGRLRNIPVGGNVRPAPSTRPGAGDHGLNSQGLERPVTRWIIPGGRITRPGGTVTLGAVNQLTGHYVQSPQGPNPLGLTLPSAVPLVRPNGTGSQNQPPVWLTQPENIFWFPQFGPVYRWIDGFWHGPFYWTSTGRLP